MKPASRSDRLDIPRTAAAAAVLFVCAALVGGCGEKRRSPDGLGPRLTVAARLPEGAVEGRASVDVIFDRPVVAMGAADPSLEEGRKYLELDPMPPGYYHWVGTRSLTYVVNGGLPLATRFTAKVPSGIRAADGTKLKGDVVWEFTTPRPALVGSIPAPFDSLMRPDDPLLLLFDQPMDPDLVREEVDLEGGPGLAVARPDDALLGELPWAFRFADRECMVLLRPRSLLDRDRGYTLKIRSSLRGLSGPLPLAKELRIPFRTYGPPGATVVKGDLRFRTPVLADSVRSYVSVDPPAPDLAVGGDGTDLWIRGLAPGTDYRVTLAAGLPDLYGQRLERKVELRLRGRDLSPSLEILPGSGFSGTSVLPLASPREVILRFAGVTELRLGVEAISIEEELRVHMPGRPGRDLPQLLYSGPSANEILTRRVPLEGLVPPGRPGAVLVTALARGTSPDGSPVELRERSVLRWSDLGVTVKGAARNGLVWVTGLNSGRPEGGAEVSVLDRDGVPRWSGRTDERGIAALPDLRGFGDPQALHIKAAARGDAALGSLAGNWRISPWRMGIPDADAFQGMARGRDSMADVHGHRAFVYGDRELYRPGETLHLTGLLRRLLPAGLGPASLDSVRLKVEDSRGGLPADTVLALDRFGGFALDMPLRAGCPVGSYQVMVSPADSGEVVRLGTGEFRVAAYRAAAFQAQVRLRRSFVTPGSAFQADVGASYFFGAPLAGAAMRWSLLRDAAGFHPPGYQDYVFGDSEREEESEVLASGEETLDAGGAASVQVPLPVEPFDGFELLTFESGVMDPSGDTVHGRAEALYAPASVVPGVSTPDRLLRAGGAAEIRVVALRADTALAAPGTPVTVTLLRREWRSVRKLLVGGRIGYESSRVDSVVGVRDILSGAEPVVLRWELSDPGSYRVVAVARDPQGRRAASADGFYVGGGRKEGAAAPWEEEPFLEITTDRKLYRPGQTARVFVSTPVRARRAILSVEREGVLESRLVELGPGATVFEVPVKASYLPNVFVGVSLVDPEIPESAAPGLPPAARLARLRIGYAELAVDVSSRRLQVAARSDREEYRPGDRAVIDLRVRDAAGAGTPARVSVAVVDEAVLALLGRPNPDPFAFFYARRGLGVRNDDTRLYLRLGAEQQLAEEKGDAGGGGGDGTDYRSEFSTVAHWSPAVFTDASGRARVEIALPDNLTRFRIVAVAAAGDDRFGTGEGSLRVTQPLTVEPALPRFASVGDVFEAAALVTNRTGRALQGTVTMESNLLVASGEPGNQSLLVEPGRTRRVAFPVRAAAAGEARVRFRADFGEAGDAVELGIPVLEPLLERMAAGAGRTSGTQPEIIHLPAAAMPGSGELAARLSPSAISGAEQAFRDVLDYPHGCLEQTASRLMVVALYKQLADAVPLGWADGLELDAKLAAGVRQMESLVLPWSTFSFWPGGREAPPWLTAYAACALAQAQHAGARLPGELLEHAAEAVRQGLRGERERAADAGRAAPLGMLLYAATEFESLTGRPVLEGIEVDGIVSGMKYMAPEDRVFLALALAQMGRRADVVSQVLAETKNRLQVTAAGAWVAADQGSPVVEPMRTGVRGTALALLLALRARPQDPLVPRLAHGLLGLRRQGAWGSTQDNALALQALTEYRLRVEGTGGAPFEARVLLQGISEPLVSRAFAQGSLETAEELLPLPASVAPGKPVKLRVERRGGDRRESLFYDLRLRWKEPALDREAEEGGFTLTRRVEPAREGGRFGLGDLVEIVLEIVVPRESWYLAVRDPLPAGLEVVHMDFETESLAEARRLGRRERRYAPLPVEYGEVRDREVRAYADHVAPGVYELRTLARVRALGSFAHAPAGIEAMYAPELNGSSGSPPFVTAR